MLQENKSHKSQNCDAKLRKCLHKVKSDSEADGPSGKLSCFFYKETINLSPTVNPKTLKKRLQKCPIMLFNPAFDLNVLVYQIHLSPNGSFTSVNNSVELKMTN